MDAETAKTLTIDELDLSVRSYNCLKRAGLSTVQDLLDKILDPADLLHIRNMGKKSAEEICRKLESVGISIGNYISEDQFNTNVILPISEIGLTDSVVDTLHYSGIKIVADLMYELISLADKNRMGLSEGDVKEISEAIRSLNLRLGIFNEPISKLGIFDELSSKLEESYDGIQDILKAGFSGLLDELASPFEAVRTAKQLQKAGYLLVGYPGLDDPETCEKLADYFCAQPLSYIGVPENVEKRMILALGGNIRLNYFSRYPVRRWYSIIQDYDACVEISEKLKKLQFPFRDAQGISNMQLGKEAFLRKYTILYDPFEEFDISKKLYHDLLKKGINSIQQLVSFSADELRKQKIAGEMALASIRKALHGGRLLLKGDYLITCKCCGACIISDDTSRTICDDCIAKQNRLKAISKLAITISGPDYGSYTNLTSGFTLYANMKNTTSDLLKVQLCDFYVVENDKQISYRYTLDGYSFDEEIIMPGTVKSAGKIWETTRFQYSTFLDSDAYIIVSIKIASEGHKRMYKFIENDGAWVIDDYYTV